MILHNPIFNIFVLVSFFVLIQVILFKTGLIYLVKKWWRIIQDCFNVYQLFKVPEFNESLQENYLYKKLSVYLHSLPSMEDSDYTNLLIGKKPNDIVLCLEHGVTVEDHFLGARVFWFKKQLQKSESNCRNFVLKIRKADKRRILRLYLQHIHTVANEIENQRKRDLKLFMNVTGDNARWISVALTHPSTFDTIAMESGIKNKVKSDLESFLKAKQYYNQLGRVWKRSFLLYGPSGTGKSSFVAAMANFLSYDVYDIDLSKLLNDSDLKMLLLQTTGKSIIVIEDLDRFLIGKSTAVSLSGVMNVMDGILNSCSAEERVMVFTTNRKDIIDPDLLRPGRVDVHIHFPLCNFSGFKTLDIGHWSLVNRYLGVKYHKLFPQVEGIFLNG